MQNHAVALLGEYIRKALLERAINDFIELDDQDDKKKLQDVTSYILALSCDELIGMIDIERVDFTEVLDGAITKIYHIDDLPF